ncbi:MAG: hypothetical protein DRQ45_03805 [Gammaproteobacteria bacterium]|nr:MAG: hypothetical protein DRQ45_03805 [Gammaproteobacteria bacterium]
MAAIYEIESGTLVSENSGITTIENHDQLPEYGIALQPVQATTATRKPGPCDEYMSILEELLKDL